MELIIVIAIMAILVGVMAPQLLKYLEKAKRSADLTTLDTIHTALVTAAADPDLNGKPNPGIPNPTGEETQTITWADLTSKTTVNEYYKEVQAILDATEVTFKSKDAHDGETEGSTNSVKVTVYAGPKFEVSIGKLAVPEKQGSN